MARKTNRVKFEVFGKEMVAEEQYYLGDHTLPTAQSKFEWSEEMVEAYERCKTDIIFFAENFFTIISAGQRIRIPLRDYQKKFLNDAMNHKRILALQARQSGKSTLMTVYALWLANFFPDQAIIICAHKGDVARMLFDRIRTAYKELPNWLKEPCTEWNKSSMRLGNGSSIVTTNTTAEGPRGNSLSCLILDEFAFVAPEIAKQFWTSVTPTLTNNPNARMFVSSTPNGIGNMFHELYEKTIAGKNNFALQKVIWSDVPGRDEAWKKQTIIDDCLGDEEMFAQEYECKFLGASNSPFPQATFDKISKDISDPILRDMDGYLQIWKLPENDRVYTMGVDVSEGVGLDASVVQVLDITDLREIEQVACYANNRIDPTAFTEIVEQIAVMYGRPVMSVERNGCGGQVCDRLYIDKAYPHFVCFGNDSNKKSRAGINSSQNTRGPAVTNMKYWLSDKRQIIVHDKAFLDSLYHFVRKPNGRWEAETNWHDDLEMSLTWALFPLHRDLVRDYFIVCGEEENGKPQRVMNRFHYVLDPDDKHLLSAKFAQYGRFNVMSFGRISHRRFMGVNMNRYNNSFRNSTPKVDPYANIKKQYKEFDDDPSWMFGNPPAPTTVKDPWRFR